MGYTHFSLLSTEARPHVTSLGAMFTLTQPSTLAPWLSDSFLMGALQRGPRPEEVQLGLGLGGGEGGGGLVAVLSDEPPLTNCKESSRSAAHHRLLGTRLREPCGLSVLRDPPAHAASGRRGLNALILGNRCPRGSALCSRCAFDQSECRWAGTLPSGTITVCPLRQKQRICLSNINIHKAPVRRETYREMSWRGGRGVHGGGSSGGVHRLGCPWRTTP